MKSKIALSLLIVASVFAVGCAKDTVLSFTEEEEKAWKTYVFPESKISVELPAPPVEMPIPGVTPEQGSFKLWSAGKSPQNLLFFFGEIKRNTPLPDTKSFGDFVDYWMRNSAAARLPESFSPQIEIERLTDYDYLGIIRAANGKQAMTMTSCLSMDENLKTIRIVLAGVSNDGQADFKSYRRAMKSAVFGGRTCEVALPHGEEFQQLQ